MTPPLDQRLLLGLYPEGAHSYGHCISPWVLLPHRAHCYWRVGGVVPETGDIGTYAGQVIQQDYSRMRSWYWEAVLLHFDGETVSHQTYLTPMAL